MKAKTMNVTKKKEAQLIVDVQSKCHYHPDSNVITHKNVYAPLFSKQQTTIDWVTRHSNENIVYLLRGQCECGRVIYILDVCTDSKRLERMITH